MITRKLNPMLEDFGRNLPKTSSTAVDSAHAGFRDTLLQKVHSDANLGTIHKESTFAARLRASHTPPEFPPASPNVLYLQALRDYITERSGTLGEGWRVEFEFCDKIYKTSAVYIAPDGRRFRSMEDVAFHFGLSSRYRYLETDNVSSESASIRSRMKIDSTNKESPAILTAQNSRQRQKVLRASKNHTIFSSSGIRELGSAERGGLHDSIHVSVCSNYSWKLILEKLLFLTYHLCSILLAFVTAISIINDKKNQSKLHEHQLECNSVYTHLLVNIEVKKGAVVFFIKLAFI